MNTRTLLVTAAAVAAASAAVFSVRAAEQQQGGIHQIDLPKYQEILPPTPGQQAFASNCLACHSPAYIATQPPMNAAKWEAEVRKMAKVYGAPIADDQVQPIVQYIMQIKEGAGPPLQLQPVLLHDGPVTPIQLSADNQARAQDLQRGQIVFAQFCSMCHGPQGHGDGLAAPSLLPHPMDLTAMRLSTAALSQVLEHGIPGTAMMPQTALPPDDLRAVATFVHRLADKDPAPAAKPEGKALYEQYCATCHGPDGAANGVAAPALPRPPINFQLQQPSKSLAVQAITDGVPGTTMPAWKSKLSDDQRQTLADYVRTLYKAD